MPANEFMKKSIDKYAFGKKVLDIGSGHGVYSSSGSEVTTVDINPKSGADLNIDLASKNLPFETNSYQCSLMMGILEFLDKKRARGLLSQVMRITSGRVYVMVPIANTSDIYNSSWSIDDFSGWTMLKMKSGYFFGFMATGSGPQVVHVDTSISDDEEPVQMDMGIGPPPQKEESKEEQKEKKEPDPIGAKIRSSFGYDNPWDY